MEKSNVLVLGVMNTTLRDNFVGAMQMALWGSFLRMGLSKFHDVTETKVCVSRLFLNQFRQFNDHSIGNTALYIRL